MVSRSRGLCLISWDRVIRPKHFGGLGVREAHTMNNALLGKLIWKIVSGDGRFWGEVLKHKYLNQDVGLDFVAGKDASYVWRSISQAWKEL